MLTQSDFEILADKFRRERPRRLVLNPTNGEIEDYQAELRIWKHYRDVVADACCAINWRFKRDLFIDATER